MKNIKILISALTLSLFGSVNAAQWGVFSWVVFIK